jgi:hypothetical protein
MPDLQTQRENAERLGYNFANIPILRPNSSPPPIQPKLTIGQPGDKYEQEADAVARRVVSQMNSPQTVQRQEMPEEDEEELQMKSDSGTIQREEMPEEDEEELQMKPESGTIQREEMPEEDEEELQMKPMVQPQAEGGMAATPDLEASIQQARGGGQPLSDNIREPMEQAFGADFGGVRVHTDATSDELNQSIQAKAFTTGQDVFFRQGAYQPGSQGGQELIAHELTHVVQQNGGAVQRRELHKQTDEIDTKAAKDKIQNQTKVSHQVQLRRKPVNLSQDIVIQRQETRTVSIEGALVRVTRQDDGTFSLEQGAVVRDNLTSEDMQEHYRPVWEHLPQEWKIPSREQPGGTPSQPPVWNRAQKPTSYSYSYTSHLTSQNNDSEKEEKSISKEGELDPESQKIKKQLEINAGKLKTDVNKLKNELKKSLEFTHEYFKEFDFKDKKLAGGVRKKRKGRISTQLTPEQFNKLVSQSKYKHLKPLQDEYQGEIGVQELEGIFASPHIVANTKYLTELGRKHFQVGFEDGKLTMDQHPFDTKDMKSHWGQQELTEAEQQNLNGIAMYVMDPEGNFYASPQIGSRFHHSSFLAGGPVAGAGEITVKDGKLLRISNSSGHYLPDVLNMIQVLQELNARGVDLYGVKLNIKYEGMEQEGIAKTGIPLDDAGVFYFKLTEEGKIQDLNELKTKIKEAHKQEAKQTKSQEQEKETETNPPGYDRLPSQPEANRPGYVGLPSQTEANRPGYVGLPSQTEANRPGYVGLPSQTEANRPGYVGLPSQPEANRPGYDRLPSQTEANPRHYVGSSSQTEANPPSYTGSNAPGLDFEEGYLDKDEI